MVDRNTIVGIDFLCVGITISALGYALAQNVSIAAVGLDIAIIGALIILIVPEAVPKETYNALLKDSISNIEIILEESLLKERAYFIPSPDGRVKAMIPLSQTGNESLSSATLLSTVTTAPERFISRHGPLEGLFLYPPGNELVHISKINPTDELGTALNHVLVELSDLASSIVMSDDEPGIVKLQIANPKLQSDSPYFNQSLGTPLSCIACCIVASVRGSPVKIVEERADPGLIRLTLQVIEK